MKMPNLASVYHGGEGRLSIDAQVASYWPPAAAATLPPAASASGASAHFCSKSRRRIVPVVSYHAVRVLLDGRPHPPLQRLPVECDNLARYGSVRGHCPA